MTISTAVVGDDSLLGGDDNDLFSGDEGADLLSGGDGRDMALYSDLAERRQHQPVGWRGPWRQRRRRRAAVDRRRDGHQPRTTI